MRFAKILTTTLSFALLFASLAFGQPRTTDEACNSLKTAVRSGAEPRSALRDVLKTKPELCPIIRCALETGIPLKAVHLAARDAGVQDNAVTQCSTSTCSQTFRLFETDEVCKLIKQEVEKGKDPAILTLEKLRQGYQSCTVLKCAVAAGADLDVVIRAARQAKVSNDIISRCCMDGCADPYRVAEILREPDQIIPIDTTKPGGTKPGYLSPSRF
ncbi:MAG: hypothetical protein Q8K68_04970 [Nitrospirota bacterium]|nr:hypothetical protein [Nitrospirota bacterium]